uniref:Uncharacterized protein n=1 Tax=Anguilla anguilla TaxID=7936 RepID=A0A0E9WLH7_ANGAN
MCVHVCVRVCERARGEGHPCGLYAPHPYHTQVRILATPRCLCSVKSLEQCL